MSKLTVSKGAGAAVHVGGPGASLKTWGNPIPFVAPWLVGMVMLGLAAAVRLMLARDAYAWYWSTLTGLMYALLTALAWWASRARGRLTNALATAGVGTASAWSWYVAGVPNFTWRHLTLYLMGMVVVCGGSMMLTAFRAGQPGGATMHDRLHAAVGKIRNLNEIQTRDGQVLARYEMEPGTAAAELQPAAQQLASLYGAPPTGVKVLPSKDDARVGTMKISPIDRLSTPPPWPGPSIRDGGTIMDPIRVGIRAGGQPLQFWLPGDPAANRNASLIQATGMSGAGKTVFIEMTVIELLSRPETEYWFGDPRKFAQAPDWLREGAARTASTKAEVIAMLRELRDEIPERTRVLGAQGLSQWQPGCGLKFRLVVCDEFADVAPDVERLITDLSETLRSLGIILLVGLQRATGDRFPTSARSNFGTHACFGVRDEVDASMGLPDEVLEAGAAPWVWGNRHPGYCYLSAPGVDEDLWPEEARTYKAGAELLAKWARYYITQRQHGAGGDVVPAGEDAEVVDDIEDAERLPVPGEGIDLDQMDDDEVAAERDELLEEALVDDEDAEFDEDIERPRVPDDVSDIRDVDERQPITIEPGRMQLRLSPRMTDQEARQTLRRQIEALRDGGVTTFKLEDVGSDVLEATGMSPSWLRKWLGKYAEPGSEQLLRRHEDERGWYDIVPAPALARGRG